MTQISLKKLFGVAEWEEWRKVCNIKQKDVEALNIEHNSEEIRYVMTEENDVLQLMINIDTRLNGKLQAQMTFNMYEIDLKDTTGIARRNYYRNHNILSEIMDRLGRSDRNGYCNKGIIVDGILSLYRTHIK